MREAKGHEFESRQPRSGDLMRNNTATCNLMMVDDWCGYRVKINFFAIFKRYFLIGSEIFAECFLALGKDFAECPKKGTRQRCLCRHFFIEPGLPSAKGSLPSVFDAKSASPVVSRQYQNS